MIACRDRAVNMIVGVDSKTNGTTWCRDRTCRVVFVEPVFAAAFDNSVAVVVAVVAVHALVPILSW